MIFAYDVPQHDHPRYEAVEYQEASTMLAPANIPGVQSATSFSSYEDRNQLESNFFLQQQMLALRNCMVHSAATVVEGENADESLSSLVDWLERYQETPDDAIEGGILTVKRSRKLLSSEAVDISSLPRRRLAIPSIVVPEEDNE